MIRIPTQLMAQFSEIVYEDWDKVERALVILSFDLVAKFDQNDTEAMLVKNNKFAALVFRGTQASKLHMVDIRSNFGRAVRWAGAGKVHSGYERHLNMVRHRARELLEEVSNDLPVFVGGHSLGGAVATAFASWWYSDQTAVDRGYKLAGLCTFGAPKSLTQEAADVIACNMERHVMRGDWAPKHPLSFSLVHPCLATVWEPVKWWPPTRISRHDTSAYIASIKRGKNG